MGKSTLDTYYDPIEALEVDDVVRIAKDFNMGLQTSHISNLQELSSSSCDEIEHHKKYKKKSSTCPEPGSVHPLHYRNKEGTKNKRPRTKTSIVRGELYELQKDID